MGNPPSPPPIDLRTLPSQTDVAYWIIILTLWGVGILSLIGSSPVVMLPFILCLFITPLYHFLALPEKELKRKTIKKIETEADQKMVAILQQAIDQLARQCQFKRTIQLLISTTPQEARSFGTWYRHYILLGEETAQKLAADWQQEAHQPKAQALLLHEIAHFVNKDVQRIGYSRELLRSYFMVMGWSLIFGVIWISLGFIVAPAILNYDWNEPPDDINPVIFSWLREMFSLSPEKKAGYLLKTQTLSLTLVLNFIIVAFMPLTIIGGLLWLFYWRRMMRLQEYYADHLASLFNSRALHFAFGRYVKWLQPDVPALSLSQKLQLTWRRAEPFSFNLSAQQKKASSLFDQLFDLHPTVKQRINQLKDPFSIHQNWVGDAMAISTLVFGIEILATSPLVSYHLSQAPLYLATLSCFIFLSSWLLPFWSTKQPYKSLLLKMTLLILGIRLILLLANIVLILLGALLMPEQLLEMLNLFVAAQAKVSLNTVNLQIFQNVRELLSLVPSLFFSQILLPFAVAFSLAVYSWVQKPALTTSPESVNWHRRHWQAVVAILIVTITLLLTPLLTLINGNGAALISTGSLISYVMGILAIGGLFFLHQQGKHGH